MCGFLFKQKTAYGMRISDWSSDVCSSDLDRRHLRQRIGLLRALAGGVQAFTVIRRGRSLARRNAAEVFLGQSERLLRRHVAGDAKHRVVGPVVVAMEREIGRAHV